MRSKLVILISLFVLSICSCQAQIFNFGRNISWVANENREDSLSTGALEQKMISDQAIQALGEDMDFTLMWIILQQVKATHLKKDSLDYKKLMLGAINGMLQSIDPWSRLEIDESAKDSSVQSSGELCGIGALLAEKGRYVVINSVFSGSPAESKGLLKGDFIVAVNDKEIRNMKIEKVVELITGERGTTVKLLINRKEPFKKKFTVEIVREVIRVETVSTSIKSFNGKKIAVIKISLFDPNTLGQFLQIIDTVEKENPDGIVIDLRNNPGGLLDSVCKICAVMCGWNNNLTVQEDSDGNQEKIESNNFLSIVDDSNFLKIIKFFTGPNNLANIFWNRERAFCGKPIVCLINRNSASASEIMAICLKENLGVKLVGERSYGKGVGQSVANTSVGLLALTTFKWLSPGGHSIDGVGIEPDFDVEMTEEDFKKDLDPQMEKGVEVLQRYFDVEEFQNKFFKGN